MTNLTAIAAISLNNAITFSQLQLTKMPTPKTTKPTTRHIETELQKSCIKWFRLQYPQQAVLLFANNQNGKSMLEQIRLNAMGVNSGTSDLLYLSPKGLYCIEIKRGADKLLKVRAGTQTDKQKEFEQAVVKAGYNYELINSFDNFVELIDRLNEK